MPSLRALEAYLKEKLITWLSPATLELQQITWDDSASLLEKIVAYEVKDTFNGFYQPFHEFGNGYRNNYSCQI